MSFDKQEQPTTKEQVEALAKAASDLLRQLNLDSPIEQVSSDTWEKEMPKVSPRRQQAKVEVNGKIRWIHGYRQQELLDDYVSLLEREGLIQWTGRINKPHPPTGALSEEVCRNLQKWTGIADHQKQMGSHPKAYYSQVWQTASGRDHHHRYSGMV